jgi:hypothetical protein
MNTRYDPRADKITVAITEAIIASQRDDEHPSLSYVETDTTLKALAVVAARIAFETKIADTAAKGATFAEKHARWSATLSKLSGRAATSILSPACSMTTPI